MVGIILGIAVGLLQIFLLVKFTDSVSPDGIKAGAVLLGMAQPFVPLAALVLCALFLRAELVRMGISLAVTIVVGAVLIFILRSRKKEKKEAE